MPPVDYSSQTYWESRLDKERESGFEWLVPSAAILPLISSSAQALQTHIVQPLKVLHFGCGSSSLGTDIQGHLGTDAQVYDADYATSSINDRTSPLLGTRTVPLLQIDVLSPQSVVAASPTNGWDLLVDKSTADAISCGAPHDVHVGDSSNSATCKREALEVLCDNLAKVTRKGGRWISVSYSSSRFAFIESDDPSCTGSWRLLGKVAVKLQPMGTEGERTVYQPETGIWAWVLERL
jgi:hypothetical protein